MKSIAVIGGGITGLAAVHRLMELGQLKQQPLHIRLIEAGNHPGGIIKTDEQDGSLIERGPDSFISEKPWALQLVKRLGIESELIETNELHRRSFIVRNGKLRRVPEGFQLLAPSRLWPFITSDIFSLPGKLRIAADLVLPSKPTNSHQDESLASFVRRRLGQEALERMAQPMIGGIYTADPEHLSLRATLPRFLDMETEHRSLILAMWRQAKKTNRNGVSGARYSLFLSFRAGMQVLVDELEKKITIGVEGIKTELCLNTQVLGLEMNSTDARWRISTTRDSYEVDGICLAVPAFVAASLLSRSASQVTSRLQEIKFASSATINFGFRRSDIRHQLDGFGFVVPFIEKRSLIACTFSSVKFAGRAPEDHVLMRAFVGGALQPEILELEDKEIVRRVEGDLRELLGVTGKPTLIEVSRWMKSMPQYKVGHLNRLEELDVELSKLKGLELAGNSYRGAGIPDCIKSAETAAEKLLNWG